MALKLHVLGAFTSPKVVNEYIALVLSTGKQVTSSWESNFSAAFHLDRIIFFNSTTHDVHHSNFVSLSHYQMESWRVESYSESFFTLRKNQLYFKTSSSVVPNLDVSATASSYKLFTKTDVHASNWRVMKMFMNIIKIVIFYRYSIKSNHNFHKLMILSYEEEHIFLIIQNHRSYFFHFKFAIPVFCLTDGWEILWLRLELVKGFFVTFEFFISPDEAISSFSSASSDKESPWILMDRMNFKLLVWKGARRTI